ncbi:hypothetical protein RCC89_02815 [Cytophagaceae bacterium ABcell3]|nr:hypothetical protein RCC89_02815 [Cytophagaceae bacterium ABcell3]
MKHLIILFFVFVLVSCKKEGVVERGTGGHAVVYAGETYRYATGVVGEGDAMRIVEQAEHYEISEVRIEDNEAVYYYKPAAGFSGEEKMVFEVIRWEGSTKIYHSFFITIEVKEEED